MRKGLREGEGAQLGRRELSVAAAGAAAVALARARGEFEGEGKPAGERTGGTVGMQPSRKREGNLRASGNPGSRADAGVVAPA
jgi:hypothetical protein